MFVLSGREYGAAVNEGDDDDDDRERGKEGRKEGRKVDKGYIRFASVVSFFSAHGLKRECITAVS